MRRIPVYRSNTHQCSSYLCRRVEQHQKAFGRIHDSKCDVDEENHDAYNRRVSDLSIRGCKLKINPEIIELYPEFGSNINPIHFPVILFDLSSDEVCKSIQFV